MNNDERVKRFEELIEREQTRGNEVKLLEIEGFIQVTYMRGNLTAREAALLINRARQKCRGLDLAQGDMFS